MQQEPPVKPYLMETPNLAPGPSLWLLLFNGRKGPRLVFT